MKLPILDKLGPGIMITAAFIGPGTVTVCLLAGNKFGNSLLWALCFAVIATIILQEMSARLGLVTGKGLGEAIRDIIENKYLRNTAFFIIICGILLGNAAYEAGNISGSLIGLKMIYPTEIPNFILNLLIYIPALCLLYFGNYKTVERFFIGIVTLMSLSFIAAVLISDFDLKGILKGFIPTIPEGSILVIVGLVGTTVVPYNLFLHASMITKKWNNITSLPQVKKDTYISIFIGGVISACILITGAAFNNIPITTVSDLSVPFNDIYGAIGKYLFGFGMFAAGFTSTITAPLAASLVAQGIFGWDQVSKIRQIRGVWFTILTVGYVFASLGYKPIEIIQLAQFANGLLLPLIAGFLLWAANNKTIMGHHINFKTQNVLSIFVLLISILLGMKSLGLLT